MRLTVALGLQHRSRTNPSRGATIQRWKQAGYAGSVEVKEPISVFASIR